MSLSILEFQAKEVGEMLRCRRKSNDLRLADVAGATGLSISYLSDLERGLRLPSIPALQKICATLAGPSEGEVGNE